MSVNVARPVQYHGQKLRTTTELREDAMRTFMGAVTAMLAWVVPALAATGGETEANGFLLYLFLGFGALIIVFQFTPGLLLFVTILRELFTRAPKKAPATGRDEPKDH